LIVSKDPKQYMQGVLFRLEDRQAAKKAFDKFKDQAVWIIKTPAFDTSQELQYNSCPLKTAVLLQPPSKMTAATPANKQELEHPAKYVDPELDLKGVLRLLACMPFHASPARSGAGSAKSPSKPIDFCGKNVTHCAEISREGWHE
jgi:hypothetical protein